MTQPAHPQTILIERKLPARLWKILRMLTRVEDFSRYMPGVKKSHVLEKTPEGIISEWQIEVEGLPIRWKQIHHYDPESVTIAFKKIEGDLSVFEGKWTLKQQGEETLIKIEVKAGLGIAVLEKVIGPVLDKKIRKNFEMMLDAMKEKIVLKKYKGISRPSSNRLKGFAVIGHPYNLQHLIRYFKYFDPSFVPPSQEFMVKMFDLTPAYKAYDIKDFKAKNGKVTNGYFIMCPIIPDMLAINPQGVIEKVAQACKIAESLEVGIVTLGGFTSIAGEKFNQPLSQFVSVPITTGNTFTVALTLDGIHKAARLFDLDMTKAKVTIIGGAGDIGGTCAKILSKTVAEITIAGRSEKNLMEMERILSYSGKARIRTSINNAEAVRQADIVIAAASSSSSILDIMTLKSGAIVCDIGYPKNISYTACDRKDILIFSGGICSLPSEFNLGFDIGMPNTQVLYGCFAEAVLLALEERYENFSWGKGNITQERVDYIRSLGTKFGFELAPFFWGNRCLEDQEVEAIAKARSI